MEPAQTPRNDPAEQNGRNGDENQFNAARIRAMVTPEQEFSASVARKRRTFTKKRSSTSLRARDQTPVRDLDDKTTTTSDEEPREPRPRTPDRRRRRVRKNYNKQNGGTKSEPEFSEFGDSFLVPPGNAVKKSNSVPRKMPQQDQEEKEEHAQESKPTKKDSLIDLAQTEVKAFLSKTKKQLSEAQFPQTEVKNFLSKTRKQIAEAANRGRDRFKKINKERVKRSQSAPHEFTQEELIESFRRAQLLGDSPPTPTISVRKYSDSSLNSFAPDVDFLRPKQFRPEVHELLRQRKQQRRPTSNKVIEILDPKTSSVLSRTRIVKNKQEWRLGEFFSVLRMYSVLEIYRSYKLYKVEMKKEYREIWALWNRCMCELFLVMVYCGFGGLIFKFTEGSFENFYKCGVKRVKRDFIDQLWSRSHNLREEDWKSLARNKLRSFEEELHTAHEAGMTSYSGQRAWSFLNGIVYAITVVTTIGYGHMYPTTTTGRALTIVYSIIGIPLFLIALTDFGKLFTRCIKFLWSFVRRLYYTGSCRKVRKTAHVQEIFKGAQMMYEIATFRRPSMFVDPESLPPESDLTPVGDDTPTTPAISNFEIDDEFNLPISLALFILIAYIFLGALIYCMWERWDFFASFYFVFISMSTIGFGDYVPRHPICMIVSIVYLVFGLALMSMCINVVQAKLSDTFKQASAKLGATMGLRVGDDGSITTVPPDTIEIPEVHGESSLNVGDVSPSGSGFKDKNS